ncbi:hypothetical protein G5I_14711 [Acromyrmex echinatior]|uniref:Uncharacterized protein n=1 Tax=Acromyrmex echinatior TaxID=103372 RepID=F4X8H2_ACREC|nr:hypothetical protein G5I_14711 [Acromyrmex echinatior]
MYRRVSGELKPNPQEVWTRLGGANRLKVGGESECSKDESFTAMTGFALRLLSIPLPPQCWVGRIMLFPLLAPLPTRRDGGAGDPKSLEILLESRIAIDAEQSLLKSGLLLSSTDFFGRRLDDRACEIIPGIGTLQHRSEVNVDLETHIHLSSTLRKLFAQRNPDSVSVRWTRRRRSAYASFELHENRVGFLRTDTRESFAALDRSTLQIQGSELKIGRRNSRGHACSLVPSRVPSRASGARVVDRQFYEWGPHVVQTLPRYAAYRFREAVRRAIGAALTLRKSSLSSSSSRSASDFENVKGRDRAQCGREQRAAAPAPATARLRGSYEPHAKRVRLPLPPRSAGSLGILGILGILGTVIENRGKNVC